MDELHALREDDSLRRVPDERRTKSPGIVFSILLGISTALFFLADGADVSTAFGPANMLVGMLLGTLIVGVIGYYVIQIALENGLSSDLMTRSGYGFMGSSIASFVYTFNFLMFTAFESTILADAVTTTFPVLPQLPVDIVVGLLFIPLCWYGVTAMDRIARITTPIYTILLLVLVYLGVRHGLSISVWWHTGQQPLDFWKVLEISASTIALVSVGTNSADVARFVRRLPSAAHAKRTAALLSFVVMAVTLLVLVPLGSLLSVAFNQANPGVYIVQQLGVVGLFFVLLTQIRINVMNIYGGSLAYANFFARAFHFAPGRHWWVIVTAVISTVLMIGGIFGHLLQILTFEAVFIVSWASTLVSDLVINRRVLHLVSGMEYRRSRLRDWNPVGVVSILVSLGVSLPMAFGVGGNVATTLAPFAAGVIGFVLAPVVAVLTRGRYYQAESAAASLTQTTACSVCGEQHDAGDMVDCPFLHAPICSVCCAKQTDCGTVCRTHPTPVHLQQPVT